MKTLAVSGLFAVAIFDVIAYVTHDTGFFFLSGAAWLCLLVREGVTE